MKKLLIDIIVATIICLFLLISLGYFAKLTGLFNSDFNKTIYQLLQSSILFFVIIGITYKRIWNISDLKKKTSAIYILALLLITFFICYNVLSINKKLKAYYTYFNSENFIAWDRQVFQLDDTLGYKMIPNTDAFQIYSYMNPIPTKINAKGFRVPAYFDSLSELNPEVDVLFLGCSFTYGSACRAEEAFPYLVAIEKRLSYINSGVGGYGLAQMYLLSQKLFSNYDPKYVVIQYSPWLLERSITEFAPTRGGYLLPAPYFSKKSNSFQVELPVFKSFANTLNPIEDRKIFHNNFFNYYFKKGLIYFTREQFQVIQLRIKNLFDVKQPPTKERDAVELFAYKEMFEKAKQNGAKVILCKIAGGTFTDSFNKLLIEYNVSVADAKALLYKNLGSESEEIYKQKYNHWGIKGKDSVFIDGHPNALAHKIIATSIIEKINK